MDKQLKNKGNFNLKELKKISLVDILNLLKKGLNPSKIAKELNISEQRLNYHISIAKSKGIIKKTGYGLWEINPIEELKTLTKATKTQPKNIRGHAFIWKVQPKKGHNWKELLIKHQINYDEVGIYSTPRVIIEGKKIWLGQKNIIIYEPESFFGQNSIESRKYAVYSLLDTIRGLETTLGIQIKDFRFTPNREHYSLIKNELARQCNKNNEKINVYNEKGPWFSIDNSFNLNEMETLGSMENKPMETNLQVQAWWNDNKANNFKVTPTFILESIKGVTNNQEMFARNIESHIKAIQELGEGVRKLTEIIEKLKGGN